jgi:hypothetical protein
MPSRRSLPFLLAAMLMLAPAAACAGESHKAKSGPHLYLAGAGLLLLAGGGAVAYYQNQAADRDMDVYRGSAFTGNTTKYRERVEMHERFTWAGLAGAALGAVLVVVSF